MKKETATALSRRRLISRMWTSLWQLVEMALSIRSELQTPRNPLSQLLREILDLPATGILSSSTRILLFNTSLRQSFSSSLSERNLTAGPFNLTCSALSSAARYLRFQSNKLSRRFTTSCPRLPCLAAGSSADQSRCFPHDWSGSGSYGYRQRFCYCRGNFLRPLGSPSAGSPQHSLPCGCGPRQQ